MKASVLRRRLEFVWVIVIIDSISDISKLWRLFRTPCLKRQCLRREGVCRILEVQTVSAAKQALADVEALPDGGRTVNIYLT